MTLETLGGYRIVRTIGRGARSDVVLAHAERDEAANPVAIKIFHEVVTLADIHDEAEALSRAAGEHVVALLDAATVSGCFAFVLERLAGPDLARVLGDRGSLRAGEVVTVLAPIAAAIGRMHAAGVTHGALGVPAIRFTAAGAPVLTGFGSARLIDPGLPEARLEALPEVIADLDALAGLGERLLPDSPLVAWARDAPRTAGFADEFEARLFALAEPEPVPLVTPSADPVVPTRVVAAPPLAAPEPTSLPRRLALPEWVGDLVPGGAVARLRASLSAVRPPVWVALGLAAAALVAAALLVPQPGQQVTTSTPTAVVTASPVVEDDPVIATAMLLEARERCIRDLSVLCLESVVQAGSSAAALDRALVRGIQAGGEAGTLPRTDQLQLVERLGNSAIVSLGPDSEPASLLLMKGEAGWRIRDYLEE